LFPLPQDGLTNLELVDAVGDKKSTMKGGNPTNLNVAPELVGEEPSTVTVRTIRISGCLLGLFSCSFFAFVGDKKSTVSECVETVSDDEMDKAKTRLKALEALMVQRQALNKKNQGGFKVGEMVEWQKPDKEWVEAVVVGTTDQQVYLVSKDEAVPENFGSCQRKKSTLVKRK
jgi:hypothetical protein